MVLIAFDINDDIFTLDIENDHEHFLGIGLLLTNKLLNYELKVLKFKSSICKFYDHHHQFVYYYRISVSPDNKGYCVITNYYAFHECDLPKKTSSPGLY